jgi:hypothetical protein
MRPTTNHQRACMQLLLDLFSQPSANPNITTRASTQPTAMESTPTQDTQINSPVPPQPPSEEEISEPMYGGFSRFEIELEVCC